MLKIGLDKYYFVMDQILEQILPQVTKPARYTGGEWNSIVKDWQACDVRWVLAFPDIYDLGMSNHGLAILYDRLNGAEGILAERAFAPWVDMEAAMRAAGPCPISTSSALAWPTSSSLPTC